VLAIAGSGWGKTSFLEGARGSGLKVADIDDFIAHDEKAAQLRLSAAKGDISWDEACAYTHAGAVARLAAYRPDVLLAHGPNIGGNTRAELDAIFAVEEWWVTAPSIDEVVKRVRARAKDGKEDRAELMARVNYVTLQKQKPNPSSVAVASGSWCELWNRLLSELMRERAPKDGISDKLLQTCCNLGGAFKVRADRFKGRVVELGNLGSFLAGHLGHRDLIDRMSIEADILHMGVLRGTGGELASCAYSLLCMDFPVQTPVSSSTINSLLEAAVCPLPLAGRPLVDISNKESRKAGYPLKAHPGASNKVNVYANEVYARAKDFAPGLCRSLLEMTAFQDGFSDDQLTSTMMFALAINPYCAKPAEIATRVVRDPKGAKQLSNAIKSLGLNSHPLGAMLCEGESLQGRGVAVPDAMSDASYRVGGPVLESKMHNLPIDKIRESIRTVLSRECPRQLVFEELEDFWHRRYQWCVNGAHSKLIERLHPGLVPDSPELRGRQVHRRVFAERLEDEPVSKWDGNSYFTLSWKLECGKTRAIYSGDSLSYFAFEHLLKPVERAWKNKRVILDPGSIGTWKIGKRIRAMQRDGPVHVMLDFDDFNSRHRLEYMQCLFEELCEHVGYPPELAEKLVGSFDKSTLLVEGKELGKVAGTLMSGHRGTTFVNSVLNEAYILACYEDLHDLKSMHVGDDVYVSAPSFRVAQELLSSCSRGGLAMNPLKQSVGSYCAEFLRVSYGETCARGYVCRSIATCVNGNWSSDVRLGGEEGLKSILGHSWTLCNRAANFAIGAVLVSSLKRICRINSTHARNLLCGAVGLKEGPVRACGSGVQTLDVEVDDSKVEEDVALASHGLGEHATIDYLTYCATPLEQYVLGEVGSDIKRMMKCASYRKTMISSSGDDGLKRIPSTRVTFRYRAVSTTVRLEDSMRSERVGGVLREYPLLQLVRKRMTRELLAQALGALGYTPTYTEEDDVLAWGLRGKALAIQGTMTYADSCALCGRCVEDLVYTDYHYYA
jgi:hypothetical protein